MENNNKDFMKNRPVAAQANQYQDVYGSQSKSTFTTISAVLTVVMFVLTLISWIVGNEILKAVFTPVFVVLVISFFVARHADKQNRPVEPKDHPEAIFKDHDV